MQFSPFVNSQSLNNSNIVQECLELSKVSSEPQGKLLDLGPYKIKKKVTYFPRYSDTE
jgi:hypothetical protein